MVSVVPLLKSAGSTTLTGFVPSALLKVPPVSVSGAAVEPVACAGLVSTMAVPFAALTVPPVTVVCAVPDA